MKIQIDNFGPIHRFECDLNKDLHLILGTNNIGKSYAITVVYLLLKSFIEAGEEFDPVDARGARGEIDALVDYFFERESGKKTDVEATSTARATAWLEREFLPRFQGHLEGTYGFMDAVVNRFSGGKPSIKLTSLPVFEIRIGTDGNRFEIKLETGAALESVLFQDKRFKEILTEDSEQLTTLLAGLGFNIGEREKSEIELSFASSFLYRFIFSQVLGKVHAIHYLPASRSGLHAVLPSFGQIFAELAKSRSFLQSRIELPGIAVPLSDYFLELSQVDPNEKREKDDPIQRIAEDIENDILGGRVEFDKKARKLFYTLGDTGLRLDMDATSSMVSELSPIVSFLRHVVSKPPRLAKEWQEGVSPKHLLFIEEPEAHLHPENQVRLMAAFAALANAGVKVMLTTHSDFLFNKLNNLILEKRIDTAAVSAMLFKQTDEGGDAVPLAMDDLGIEDENFIDATEWLYDEKVDLIDRMNRDGDDGDAE